ncbi:MAG: hypothetical protein JKY48_16855 [Flavobacteriales bacterium]|nr:hypothetical protein [Flavobacteriales bacterium]
MKTTKSLKSVAVVSIGLLFLTACSLSEINDTNKNIYKAESVLAEPDNSSESNCLHDKKVSIGVCTVMKNSYKYTVDNWNTIEPTEYDPQWGRKMSTTIINELLAKCEEVECDGVRIYFGYADSTIKIPISPELLLVNTNNCNSQLFGEDPVLLASASSEPHFISIETAAEMTKNWQNAINKNWATLTNSNQYGGWIYDSVYAYTFMKDVFSQIENSEVLIDFTMRVNSEINPAFIEFSETLQIGLLVHSSNLTIPGTFANSNVDIAFPCPKDCGTSNVLYQHTPEQ